jgi:hypothetical protein
LTYWKKGSSMPSTRKRTFEGSCGIKEIHFKQRKLLGSSWKIGKKKVMKTQKENQNSPAKKIK